jgi:phosphomannomutase
VKPEASEGVSAESDDRHFDVRQSNTSPLLRLNLAGLTPEIVEKRRDELLAIIRS